MHRLLIYSFFYPVIYEKYKNPIKKKEKKEKKGYVILNKYDGYLLNK
jgi:hypothetical protein